MREGSQRLQNLAFQVFLCRRSHRLKRVSALVSASCTPSEMSFGSTIRFGKLEACHKPPGIRSIVKPRGITRCLGFVEVEFGCRNMKSAESCLFTDALAIFVFLSKWRRYIIGKIESEVHGMDDGVWIFGLVFPSAPNPRKRGEGQCAATTTENLGKYYRTRFLHHGFPASTWLPDPDIETVGTISQH